jgi:hypothetical protein
MLANLVDARSLPLFWRTHVAAVGARRCARDRRRDDGGHCARRACADLRGFRARRTRRRARHGTRLAIVKRIAERHGATVELGDGAGGRGLDVVVRFAR